MSHSRPVPAGSLVYRFPAFILFPLIFLGALQVQADAPPTSVRIQSTGIDVEGLYTFRLEWDAVSNTTYLVQSGSFSDAPVSNANGLVWTTIDMVQPDGSVGSYPLRSERSEAKNVIPALFRLVLPSPWISSVEPAVFASGAPVTVYVLGQCFQSNDVVRVDGMNVSGVTFIHGDMLACPLPPQTPGRHIVELMHGGVVAASSSVTVFLPANPESTLQGPPILPLARSGKITKSRSNIQNNRMSGGGGEALQNGDENDPMTLARGGKITKSRSNIQNNRMGGDGGEALQDDVGNDPMTLARGGKITKSRSNIQNNRLSVVGSDSLPDNDGDDVLLQARDACNNKLQIGGENSGITAAIRSRIDLHSGEVELSATDLVIPGVGLDFIWARTYHSRIGRNGASANGWTFSYDVSIQSLGGGIVIHNGTGRADTFTAGTNGVYACPEFFSEGTITGGVFRLTFADTGYWEFNPINPGSMEAKLARIVDRNGNTISLNYDASGRLMQIVDDLGRKNTVAYDSAGRLASVTDFAGRTVTYQYYRGVPGEPGGAGDLQSVTSPRIVGTPNGNDFPAGKITTYTYSTGYLDDRENHLLLSVRDAAGRIVYKHVYQHNQTDLEFIRCISVQQDTNSPTLFRSIPLTVNPGSGFAALRCIVNDPVGNVSEFFLDARGRLLRKREFTGRSTPGTPVTDTLNRPKGPLRVDDPLWFETQFRWNNDSLCTRVMLPHGNQAAHIYESDFDPSTRPRKRADLRVVREYPSPGPGIDVDGDGVPDFVDPDADGDGVADLTERVWRYDYDPRFGSEALVGLSIHPSATARERQLQVMRGVSVDDGLWFLRRGYAGNPEIFICPSSYDLVASARDTRGKKYRRVLLQQARMAFPTNATDPRGNPTTYDYDPHGNLVRRLPGRAQYTPITLEMGIAHDERGRVTSITNAPDANGFPRVDTFRYYTNGPQAGYLQSFTLDDRAAIGLREYSSFQYDVRGNVTRYVDPRTNDWLYTYNELDQLVQRQSPELRSGNSAIPPWRITTQFAYDSRNNLTLVRHEDRDHNGVLAANPWWNTQFNYDDLSRLTSCWRDKDKLVLRCTSASYDANGNVTLLRAGEAVNGHDPHAEVSFEYDERNLPFRRIEAPGTPSSMTSQYDYDASGNLARLSRGLEGTPSVTTFEYDGFAGFDSVTHEKCCWINLNVDGRISRITDPMGNVEKFAFDANDNLTFRSTLAERNDSPGGAGNLRYHEWRWSYDAFDQCISRRTAFFDPGTQLPMEDGQCVWSFSYAPNGQWIATTDPLGLTMAFNYDTVGRLSGMSSASNKTEFAVLRDRSGNVTTMSQTDHSDLGGAPQVFTTTRTFDALDRCIGYVDDVGNHEGWDLDSRGNSVRHIDANGVLDTAEYDGLNRKLKVFVDSNGDGTMQPDELLRTRAWDDNDRLMAETDSNNNTTQYAYDSRDRLVTATQADGTVESLVWSPRSNLASSRDANGTVVNYSHDLNDRLVGKSITPGPGVAATTTFEQFSYDGDGRLAMASNDVSRVEFFYDSMGNNTRVIRDGWEMLAAFDKNGDRTVSRYPSGLVVSNTYNVLRQISSIAMAPSSSVPPVTVATYAYDAPGRIARIGRITGINTRIFYDGLHDTPNAPGDFGWGQVSRINHARAGGSPVVDQRSFAYDRNQNRILRAQLVPVSPAVLPRTNTFGHDVLQRLTSFTDSVLGLVRFYALDAEGNRRYVTNGAVVETYTRDNTLPEPADFQMNQYTLTPFGAREYDSNGNLHANFASDGLRAYEFDYADRLVNVARFDGAAFVPVVSFSYNALGQRISKTAPGSGTPPAPVTTQFIYGGVGDADCILERRQFGTLLDSLIHKMDDAEMIMRIGANGGVVHYYCDDLGSTIALTDGTGTVLERNEYADFGKPQFLNSDGLPLQDNGQPVVSSPSGNPFLFCGMEWDSETGFYYAARKRGGGVEYQSQTGAALGLSGGENPLFEGSGFTMNPLYEKEDLLRPDGSGGGVYFDPQTASILSGRRKQSQQQLDPFASIAAGNERVLPKPWEALSPRPPNPNRVQFNPKEIGLDKSVPWTKK